MEERRIAGRPGAASPRFLARLGGLLYLVIIVLGLFQEISVRNRIVVPGDAVATAANLRTHEQLWRSGIAAEMLLLLCALALLVIFLVLLRPVSRDLAFLAVAFNLVAIAVEAVAALSLVEALFPLGTARYLAAFRPEQLDALASLAIRGHGHGFGVSLIFFGCFCVAGALIFRSGYLPRTLGILMQIAGACYLVDSFALLLAPALADRLFPAILLPAFVGESSLCLWLLIKGVDVERWNAWDAAAAS